MPCTALQHALYGQGVTLRDVRSVLLMRSVWTRHNFPFFMLSCTAMRSVWTGRNTNSELGEQDGISQTVENVSSGVGQVGFTW